MDAEILKADVFEPVANRVKGNAESLMHVRRFKYSGIEGWFKVEAVRLSESALKASRTEVLTFDSAMFASNSKHPLTVTQLTFSEG